MTKGAVAGTDSSVQRYRLELDGVVLEISAPRADILRVRAGRGRLPEDASWAVNEAVRQHPVALRVERHGRAVVLRTSALTARIDTATLHLAIADREGHDILDDAPGAALELARAGAAGGLPVRLRKRMPADAHYFGLGDKAGPLDRRGETFVLWNTDAYAFGETTDPLYKSIPFVLGVREDGGSFGLFVDNTWRSSFDFGRTERDTLTIAAEGGPVDYYVMAGSTPKTIVEAYAFLTGTPPLPPRWALGFQQSRYSYGTEAEVREVAARLRGERIPTDVIYLDIDYQDRDRPFTVSETAFPDLPQLVADLKASDFKLVLITDLHIANVDDGGYPPYTSGQAIGAFLRRPDGGTFVAEVWPGPSVFPDFSRSRVREWWGELYGGFVRAGVAGFWNDMNEPAVFEVRDKTMPLDTVHRIEEPGFASRDATHAEMHNVYGMLNSRATFEGLGRLQADLRPFVLTRATYAGGQRYAATWTGDNISSWGHLRLATSQLQNLGLSGFGLAGDDIGGFAGNGPAPELLTRWIEIGAFNPVFRDHAAKGKPAQEPYIGPAEQVAIRRHYIEERYRLMPYLYGIAEEQSRTGVPMMRPVFLEFPGMLARGERLGGTADEFMLGPDLLIAPAGDGESPAPYTVTLPGDGWFDYWTGLPVTSDKPTEMPRLDRLPVFVRPGAILARQPLIQSTTRTPNGPLEIGVYPGPECAGSLYFDDGVSFAYRHGEYLRQRIRCRSGGGSVTVEVDGREGSYSPWWSTIDVVVHGIGSGHGALHATFRGKAVPVVYDAASQSVSMQLPDVAQPSSLTIEYGP